MCSRNVLAQVHRTARSRCKSRTDPQSASGATIHVWCLRWYVLKSKSKLSCNQRDRQDMSRLIFRPSNGMGANLAHGHACHSYSLAEASLSMRHFMCMRRLVAYPRSRMQWRLRKSCSTIMYVPVASGTCPCSLWTTAETSNGMPFAQARAIGDEKLKPLNSMWKICSSPVEHACVILYVPTAPGS